jgi:hypothetical protein
MSTMNVYWKECPSAPGPQSALLPLPPAPELCWGYRQKGPRSAPRHAERGNSPPG